MKKLTVIIIALFTLINIVIFSQSANAKPDEDENTRVLLVSSAIVDADVLASAAADNVIVISYDAESATLGSILSDISDELRGGRAASIGIAAHDYGEAKFYLAGTATIGLGSTLSSLEQRAFWKELGEVLTEDGRIDLFACNLAKTDQGKMLISLLEDVSGAVVTASDDDTGNISAGGDWLLERGDVDAGATYFRVNALAHFGGLLFSEVKKLTASDAAAADYFGISVSISGDTAIVGAAHDDDNGSASGSAYIFGRNRGGADNWGEVRKLTASDAAAADYFGISVSISGDTAIVGAAYDDDNGNSSGSAYIFDRNSGGADNWGEVRKLTASDAAAADYFGISVSISGDTAIVGAAYDDDNGNSSGSAYIFGRNRGGADNWGEVRKLTASDAAAADFFGFSVSISGDTAIVGAAYDDDNGNSSGSAYIFGRNSGGADNWGEVRKLTASDAAAADNFGISVSISGDTAIVGAYHDDDNGNYSGSAYIFDRNSGGADNWGEVGKLTASDAATNDIFGRSVSISGDTAIVGAAYDDDNGNSSGSAYIFGRNRGGADNWGEVRKLTASDAATDDIFGQSVSISGDTAIVGAERDDDNGNSSGSAYIFVNVNSLPVASDVSIIGTGYPFTGSYTYSDVYGDPEGTSTFKWYRADDASGTNLTAIPLATSTTYTVTPLDFGKYLRFEVTPVAASGASPGNAVSSPYSGRIQWPIFNVIVISTAGGSTDRDGQNAVAYGDSITIFATADPGYSFAGWSGDASGSANPLTVYVTSSMTITANFVKIPVAH